MSTDTETREAHPDDFLTRSIRDADEGWEFAVMLLTEADKLITGGSDRAWAMHDLIRIEQRRLEAWKARARREAEFRALMDMGDDDR